MTHPPGGAGELAVLLPVGADLYALPMTSVREVLAVTGRTITPLVTARPVVLGLVNLRGEIVPLLDSAAVLGVGTVTLPTFAAVLNTPYGLIGLAATAVPERVVLDVPAGPSALPGTSGTFRVDGRVAILLDPAALLTPEHLGAPEGRGGRVRVGVA